MRHIIVPTDFSLKSFNALNLAKRISRKTGGTIHLIHVVEGPAVIHNSTGEVVDNVFDDIYMMKFVEKLTEELMALKEANKEDTFEIRTDIIVGDPFLKIKHQVTKYQAELVIMGAKGITDAEEFFLGSLTDKVVRSLPCPVISVKEVVEDDQFKSIVYATDLEEDHQPLIYLLKRLQELFNARLHIVKINTRKNFTNDIDTKVKLQRLADKHQLTNYTLSSYSHEDEEYGIVYFADAKQADLIAMGVHEISGIRRLISGGSLVSEVSEHTFRPVLTYNLKRDQR